MTLRTRAPLWVLTGLIPWTSIIIILGCRATPMASRGQEPGERAEWFFDHHLTQRPPPGWRIAATNPTAALATWQVVEDPTAPSPPHVLALTRTENHDGTYNLAVAGGPVFQDLDLSVRVKAVAGEEDQGGGPIWRCQDENHYYICRLNPLEGNFRVYVVTGGKRRQLDSAKLELSAGRWYEIRVRMVGNRITCDLDGVPRLTATDGTLAAAGRVGLWTKADAVTSFDDLVVRPVAAAPGGATPPATAPTTSAASRLRNILRVSDRILSGSAPDGDADFAAIRDLGARTVLSVDGATPDVARATAAGLRYVHLPIGYHGMDRRRQLQLARAIRDLPGPVYVHCHHGVHRGPAAAALAAVQLGDLNTSEAVALLRKAGTSEHYRGLYACVAEAAPVSAAELSAVPADFPAVAPLPGFVAGMAQAQDAFDHLVAIRDAGWRVPADHPDLVPLAEAQRLAELMRGLQVDPDAVNRPDDFRAMQRDSAARAQEFEDRLRAGAPPTELTSRLQAVGASCKACHTRYRDNR